MDVLDDSERADVELIMQRVLGGTAVPHESTTRGVRRAVVARLADARWSDGQIAWALKMHPRSVLRARQAWGIAAGLGTGQNVRFVSDVAAPSLGRGSRR